MAWYEALPFGLFLTLVLMTWFAWFLLPFLIWFGLANINASIQKLRRAMVLMETAEEETRGLSPTARYWSPEELPPHRWPTQEEKDNWKR